MVTAQCRSRENSLEEARTELLRRLKSKAQESAQSTTARIRRNQVGSGERGDKVRTYRFQDDTVKDHVSGKISTCNRVLAGYFEVLWS